MLLESNLHAHAAQFHIANLVVPYSARLGSSAVKSGDYNAVEFCEGGNSQSVGRSVAVAVARKVCGRETGKEEAKGRVARNVHTFMHAPSFLPSVI